MPSISPPPAPVTAAPAPPARAGAPAPPHSTPAPPGLRLDVLVYGDAPAGRMAFINGRKYVQGQSVEGGFVVDRITEDGVVLSQQGQIFLLTPPRR
jgi:general secretion pathway protein B